MNHHPSTPTPSAELRRGIFPRLARFFRAKSPQAATGPLKPLSGGLEIILLPHARTRWMLPAAGSMTPTTIESILKEALIGKSPRREQELYSLMEATWPRLLKNKMEVVDAVLSLDWNLMDPPPEEQLPGARELIKRAMNGMKGDPFTDGHGWRATLSSLLDGWFRGISISEIEWEYRGGSAAISNLKSPISNGGLSRPPAWLPRQTRDLSPWHFGWRTGPYGSSSVSQPSTLNSQPNDGRLVLYPDASGQSGIDFPPNKFLVAIRKAGKGHPSGTALLRCLAWWWCSANFSQEWLLNFAQIFGQPFRWATYDGSQDGVKDDLATMMENMGSAAWGIGPDGTKVEWHESTRTGADNPQSHILTLADTACDLLLLGQTLTSTQGERGSQALGTVHQSVRADIIDSAAAWLAEVFNEQFIPAVITLNCGDIGEDSALPWFQPTRKAKQDSKIIAETFEILLRAGIPLLKEEVYDALDMSMPAEGDETFGGISNLKSEISNGAQAPSPDLRRLLAKLPLDAREYFMARMLD